MWGMTQGIVNSHAPLWVLHKVLQSVWGMTKGIVNSHAPLWVLHKVGGSTTVSVRYDPRGSHAPLWILHKVL